jgi:2-C-methyl-D-erythritol 2,4-cyclodiphosphate synthase
MRIGSSMDIHRLVENRKLIIGGVEIPSNKGSLAHSDGDVLIHAIVDALIGALGLGDIGEHFSDKDPKYQNISSIYFLKVVKEMLKEEGYEIVNIDSLVKLESPKLKGYKRKMEETIALNLEIDPEHREKYFLPTNLWNMCLQGIDWLPPLKGKVKHK